MHAVLTLLLDLCERLGLLAVLFFLMMRLAPARRLLTQRGPGTGWLFPAALFGLAGAFANVAGFPVDGAIANLRGVPVALGGMLGGPVVGLAAGAISGGHRWMLDAGSATSLACGLAAPLQGLLAALLYRRFRRRPLDTLAGLATGAASELLRLGMILLLARPAAAGPALVKALAIPTVFANACGVGLLIELLALFSTQIELGEVERQRRLLADAEVRALQAQINPHFLFNAISTIRSYVRTDAARASELLVQLAEFFRRNIGPGSSLVPLSVELEHCRAYVALEQARFGERLAVRYDVEPSALACELPPLTLQPLVENGVRHGILPRERGGVVSVSARRAGGEVLISVSDDGVGIPPARLAALLSGPPCAPGPDGLGIALRNVNGRLAALHGPAHALRIESRPGAGTQVCFRIPVSG